MLDRTDKVLRHVKKDGYGLEIGPSHNPIAPKRDGYKVDIIDHMSRTDLIEKYRHHGVNLDNIEEVDYVWQGESYADLTGKAGFYDWVIASHVIEHTPDMISFLNDCASLLKDDGVLSLVIPDKRFCFDYYRPITGIAQVIDNHLNRNVRPSVGIVAEYYLNVAVQDGALAWSDSIVGEKVLLLPPQEAIDVMNRARNTSDYIDVHVSCFVPHSLRLIFHDLWSLGFIQLKEVDFLPTSGCEFFVTLSKSGQGCPKSRLELLKQIEQEQKMQFVKPPLPSAFGSPAAFDELSYLERYPDVKAAVEAGIIISGYDHYCKHGWHEGRVAAPPLSAVSH